MPAQILARLEQRLTCSRAAVTPSMCAERRTKRLELESCSGEGPLEPVSRTRARRAFPWAFNRRGGSEDTDGVHADASFQRVEVERPERSAIRSSGPGSA
jgi:hypothetical protein